MITLRGAAQQALEALEDAQRHHYALRHAETDILIAALRAALAEPDGGTICPRCGKRVNGIHTCTAPLQRRPLSDEDIYAAIKGIDSLKAVEVARAIEKAHGIT